MRGATHVTSKSQLVNKTLHLRGLNLGRFGTLLDLLDLLALGLHTGLELASRTLRSEFHLPLELVDFGCLDVQFGLELAPVSLKLLCLCTDVVHVAIRLGKQSAQFRCLVLSLLDSPLKILNAASRVKLPLLLLKLSVLSRENLLLELGIPPLQLPNLLLKRSSRRPLRNSIGKLEVGARRRRHHLRSAASNVPSLRCRESTEARPCQTRCR
jgi:hypothetical protein